MASLFFKYANENVERFRDLLAQPRTLFHASGDEARREILAVIMQRSPFFRSQQHIAVGSVGSARFSGSVVQSLCRSVGSVSSVIVHSRDFCVTGSYNGPNKSISIEVYQPNRVRPRIRRRTNAPPRAASKVRVSR